MREYNNKRTLAFYQGYLLGHKNALLMICGELHKQIDSIEKKVNDLEAQCKSIKDEE